MIRLLNYRTTHNWIISTDSADLHIISEEMPETASHKTTENVLLVGHSTQHSSPFLHLPIHANELELLLNTLGSNILEKKTNDYKGWPARIGGDELFMLQRWPPASMLGTAMQIKLATLITAHPISMETLVQRSAATWRDCEVFCQTLDRAGLLQRSHSADKSESNSQTNENPIEKLKHDMSLLRRIRRSLGI